jgi:hypothetical protein
VVQQVEDAVAEAVAEVERRCAADAELVPGDVIEEVALDLPLDVAVELCLQQMNFVPDTIRQRVFAADNEDSFGRAAERRVEREAAEAKSRQRSQRAAATRANTAMAEAEASSKVIRSKTCPLCFTVRAPSGACACE